MVVSGQKKEEVIEFLVDIDKSSMTLKRESYFLGPIIDF